MLDDIFKDLYSRTVTEEWTSIKELKKILEKQGLGQKETEGIMRFLKSYFLEVDEIGMRVRLNSWVHNFLKISTP